MKKSTKNSLVIGAKVLIDWPVRWKDCRPEYRDEERAKASKTESRFGETGVIVAYNPGTERANDYEVLLDSTGRIESFYVGALTVTAMPPDPSAETNELLVKILAAIGKLDKNIVAAVKDTQPAL
jgi:hypothetical protein